MINVIIRGIGYICGITVVFRSCTFMLYDQEFWFPGALIVTALWCISSFLYFKRTAVSNLFIFTDILVAIFFALFFLSIAIIKYSVTQKRTSLTEIGIIVVTIGLYFFLRSRKIKIDMQQHSYPK